MSTESMRARRTKSMLKLLRLSIVVRTSKEMKFPGGNRKNIEMIGMIIFYERERKGKLG